MRNPLSKTVMELEPSGIRRFFDVANTMDNVISLGVGEPDFDTPWHIREEGIYSLEKGRTYYTSNAGLLPLRREISRYLHDRFDLPYGPDEILVTVGGSEAIDILIRVTRSFCRNHALFLIFPVCAWQEVRRFAFHLKKRMNSN